MIEGVEKLAFVLVALRPEAWGRERELREPWELAKGKHERAICMLPSRRMYVRARVEAARDARGRRKGQDEKRGVLFGLTGG